VSFTLWTFTGVDVHRFRGNHAIASAPLMTGRLSACALREISYSLQRNDNEAHSL